MSARVSALRKYFEPGRAPAALAVPWSPGSSSSSSGASASAPDEGHLEREREHVARALAGAASETFPSSPHYWLEKRPSRWVFARESVRPPLYSYT